jgi:hypothetical protein
LDRHRPALSNFVRLRANYFVPVVPVPVVSVPPPRRVSRRSWRPVRRVSRRSWRPARRSPRRSIPLVWASASDTVSTVAGTAKPYAAVNPRTENTLRRDISSNLVSSVIFKLLSRLPPFSLSHPCPSFASAKDFVSWTLAQSVLRISWRMSAHDNVGMQCGVNAQAAVPCLVTNPKCTKR